MSTHEVSPLAFERMFRAVEKVRDRLRRAVAALEADQIPYAVIGDRMETVRGAGRLYLP